jgi:hypothetical protein
MRSKNTSCDRAVLYLQYIKNNFFKLFEHFRIFKESFAIF